MTDLGDTTIKAAKLWQILTALGAAFCFAFGLFVSLKSELAEQSKVNAVILQKLDTALSQNQETRSDLREFQREWSNFKGDRFRSRDGERLEGMIIKNETNIRSNSKEITENSRKIERLTK